MALDKILYNSKPYSGLEGLSSHRGEKLFKGMGHVAVCTYVVQYTRLSLGLHQDWVAEVYSTRKNHIDMLVHISSHILPSLDGWTHLLSVCKGVTFAPPQHSCLCHRCLRHGVGGLIWDTCRHRVSGHPKISVYTQISESCGPSV